MVRGSGEWAAGGVDEGDLREEGGGLIWCGETAEEDCWCIMMPGTINHTEI